MARTVCATLLAAALVGCATPGPSPADLTYASSLSVELSSMNRTPEGLYWQDISMGVGDSVERGDQVSIHYMGWFPDGELFDSSVAFGEAVSFEVGTGDVIEGWELGLQGMREGGRRRLVVPPGLAYGSRGISGAIPGNATLVFEVQLLRIEG
jgi:FKBP-type peptidyl-prolyl cis-trans isomerase